MTLPKFLKSTSKHNYSPAVSILLIFPIITLLLGVFIYPISKLLLLSFFDPDFTMVHYKTFFMDSFYIKVLLRTLVIAFLVALFSFLLGYPVAYMMAKLEGWKANIIAAFVLIPLWSSVLVRSYSWTVLLQRNGIINTWLMKFHLINMPLEMLYTEGAVLVTMTHVLLPYMILPIYSTMRGIPGDLTKAAVNLGASHLSAFRHVFFPLSLPGVAAGSLFVFILSIGFFITPALIGGPKVLMIATLMELQMTQLLNWPFAASIACVLLLVTLLLAALFHKLMRVKGVFGDDA